MLMECAATSLERWQWNTHRDTHTHLFFCQKKRRRENKKKTNLTCNNNSRHATPFGMSYDRLLSSLSAGCDAMRLCSACHLPHATCCMAAWLHAAYRMPDVPHSLPPLPIPSPPPPGPPPPAMPMWIGGAVVIWGFRIVVDRLLIFAIVLHAPQKALCIVGATVARGVVYRVIVIVIVVIYAAAAVAADAAWNVQCDYIVNKNALE